MAHTLTSRAIIGIEICITGESAGSLVDLDQSKFRIQNIDATLIPAADMTKMKTNGTKDKIILNSKLALIYCGFQCKPSSGSECKKMCENKTVTNTNLNKNT